MATTGWKLSRRAAATAVTLLVGASAAHGRVIIGQFDPVASGGFPGYKGSASFDVSPSCLPAGNTGFAFVTADCGPVTFLGGTISLYGPGPITGAPASSFVLPAGAVTVTGIYVVNGQVFGIDSTKSGFSFAPDPVNGFSFSGFALQFFSGCGSVDPYDVCGDLFGVVALGAGEVLPAGVPSTPFTQLFSTRIGSGLTGFTSDSLVFRVPEPGSMALLAAALGGGWFARRRKKQSFDLA